MTTADVSALIDLMVKHGCTRIICDGVTIERPLPPPPDPRVGQKESDFERFRRLSDDQQERIIHERMNGSPLGMPEAMGMGRRR